MRPVIEPTRGWLRLLRGTSVAAVGTLLAAVGHAGAGGAVPDLGTLVVLGALLAALMTALADRRARPVALLAALGSSQVVLHLLLQVMRSHPHYPVAGADTVQPVPMIVVHVVATLVSALLLAHAEHVVFLVAAALARIAPRRLAPPPVPGLAASPAPVAGPPVALCSFLYALVLGQRGPPVQG